MGKPKHTKHTTSPGIGGFLKGLKSEASSLINKFSAGMEGRNPVYIAVQELKDEAEKILSKHETVLKSIEQLQVIDAARAFIQDLNDLLEGQKYVYQNVYNSHLHKLAEDCLDIIFKHQRKLEVAPGFWNQLKGIINNFIEYVTGHKNTFATEGTHFSKSTLFQQRKHEVETMKEELELEAATRPSPSN